MMMMGRRRHGISPVIAMVVASGFFLMVGLSKASGALGAASIPIWAMAIGGVVLVLRGPLGEAILRSISADDGDPERAAPSQEVLNELDDLRAQMAELQERVDFTERLLAREREERTLHSGEKP
jgi:hypothetical protein